MDPNPYDAPPLVAEPPIVASPAADWALQCLRIAWTTGILANLAASGVMLTLLFVEPGARIRPMMHAVIAVLSVAGAVMIGVPASLAALCHRQTRFSAIFAMALNLAVYPLMGATLLAVQAVVGFTLAE